MLFTLALGVRMIGADAVLQGQRVHLIDPDSHFHSWRMILSARSFPALPSFEEKMLAHPRGVILGWPPGLDYLGGALSRLLGASGEDESIARLGTLLVAFLGALTALVVFGLCRRLVSFPWALVGGVAIALWPLHIEYSRVGRVDYHVMEPLMIALAALTLLSASSAPSRRGSLVRAVGAGACLGGSLWFWTTALLPVLLVGAVLLLFQLSRPRLDRVAPVALFTSMAIAAPLCLAEPYRGTWVLHTPSMLHLLLIAVQALCAAWFSAARPLRRRLPPLAGWGVTVAGAGCCLALLLLAPLRQSLDLAMSFGGRDGFWGMILEQRPLANLPLGHIFLLGTYVLIPLPLLVLLGLFARGAEPRRLETLFITLLAGATLILGLNQIRFLPLAFALCAPLCALGCQQLASRLTGAVQGQIRPALRHWIRPITAIGFLCLFWPTAEYLDGGLHLPTPRSHDQERAARWIRAHPGTGRTAVMAPLSTGHVVVHLGRAPVVGSALIDPGTEEASRDTLRFYTATDLRAARALLDRRKIGRVVVSALPAKRLARYLRYLGRPFQRRTVLFHHRRILSTRLFFDLGSGAKLDNDFLPAITFLQHRWESRRSPSTEPIHIFEVVRGAAVTGVALRREVVTLELSRVTNRGRPFSYKCRQRADGRGRFTFRVPYFTSRAIDPEVTDYLKKARELQAAMERGALDLPPLEPLSLDAGRPLGPAIVAGAGRRVSVDISSAAVDAGHEIIVQLPPLASP